MPDESNRFDFITEDDLRGALSNDYAEIERSISGGNWKSALVMAGSIVEAVLVDALGSSEFPTKTGLDPLSMTLNDLIKHGRAENFLTPRTSDLASVVRDYRNVIHPGRQFRTKDQPDEDTARVAKSLVDIILREVGTRRQNTQGFTAEQLLWKLQIDPSAARLIRHHLRDMRSGEVLKFLRDLAPQRYISLVEREQNSESEEESDQARSAQQAIVSAYRSSLSDADNSVRQIVAKKFISILRDGTAEYIRRYAIGLFRADDLEYLSSSEQNFAKDYLLGQVDEHLDNDILDVIRKLPRFLTREEIRRFIDRLVLTVLSKRVSDSLSSSIRSYLSSSLEDDTIEAAIIARLEFWSSTSDEKYKDIISPIIEWRKDLIPF